MLDMPDKIKRLEYLRGELRAERISYGEIAELQDLAARIDPGDVELLEAAGLPEFESEEKCLKASGQKHEPEPSSLAYVDGDIFDVNCKHCGRSGSLVLHLDDINDRDDINW